MTVSNASNCHITFTIVIYDTSKGSFMTIIIWQYHIFIVQSTVLWKYDDCKWWLNYYNEWHHKLERHSRVIDPVVVNYTHSHQLCSEKTFIVLASQTQWSLMIVKHLRDKSQESLWKHSSLSLKLVNMSKKLYRIVPCSENRAL